MRPWPDLTALELLVAIADHGSLSAAARAVRVAQPNASRSIARLERHFELPLVHRATTGATLTPAGLLVVQWARGVLVAASTLADGAVGLRQHGGVTITVSASQTVAEHLLPMWLSTLRQDRRDASVVVHVHNTTEVIDDVLHGRCAVGFTESPTPPRGVHHLQVGADELVLVVAHSHPWARRRRPVTAQELATTALVTREPGSGTRTALDEALSPAGPIVPALQMPSNAAVRVSVAAGTAPAVLSRLAVAEQVAAGAMRIVPLADLDLHRPLRAIWTGPRRLDGVAADLVAIAGRSFRHAQGMPGTGPSR